MCPFGLKVFSLTGKMVKMEGEDGTEVFENNKADNSAMGTEHRMTDIMELLIWNTRYLKFDKFCLLIVSELLDLLILKLA